MRPIAALAIIAGLFVVAYALPVKAQEGLPLCYAKDQIIQQMAGDQVRFRKVVGAEAEAFRVFSNAREANATTPDPEGFTYVVFWRNDAPMAVVYGFDLSNCAAYRQSLVKDEVLGIIGEAGA